MNAPVVRTNVSPDLAHLVIGAFNLPETFAAEHAWLQALQTGFGKPAREVWQDWLRAPAPEDRALCGLLAMHELSVAEMVAIALCCAVERDPMLARILHCLQSPTGGSLPTLGFVARAAMLIEGNIGNDFTAYLTSLHSGIARRLGLIEIAGDSGVLVERSLRTPHALMLTLAGFDADWPEIQLPIPAVVPLGEQVEGMLQRLALSMESDVPLMLRSPWLQDGFSAAVLVAQALGRSLVHVPQSLPTGAGIWLSLTRRIPVFSFELAPGESRQLPPIPGYEGPVLMVTGLDGTVSWNHAPVAQLAFPVPPAEDRVGLWRKHGVADTVSSHMGTRLRLSASRIHVLSGAAHRIARQQGRENIEAADVAAAARGSAVLDLGTLAELLPWEVEDEALVLQPRLRESLEQLLARCEKRDALADGLGISVRTRYRPGVRALFTGMSGTGKTLAVSWLATRLGLPLYRVDMSAVVSKYIGETEKNLAQLFARAENAEVVLLFDEADSLFGKRTDVKDSTDRFANQQTNYLLQRIESFDGIAVLTSNSRSRFDSAFTRRLDMVIEFPAPTPEERRALWVAHLGEGHALDMAEINRVAALCDLAGGHVRSCALMAASLACPVGYPALRSAIMAEYAKLGRMPPAGL